MVRFTSVLLATASVVFASPATPDFQRLDAAHHDARIRAGLVVSTPLGPATGVLDTDGANRFSVRYASSQRWKPSTVATTWQFPNDAIAPNALPLACAQDNAASSSISEDCLSVILYVPPGLKVDSKVPTMVWLHGGSFMFGSATAPGLDGSKLALGGGAPAIVAVVQYRLGALGFLNPLAGGESNLGAKDVVNALKFLGKVLPSFGGSASKVTIAGQSSGATLIRAILAAPSASSYFRSAILQSDPMDFGFLPPTSYKKLVDDFTGQLTCADDACYQALPLQKVIETSMSTYWGGKDIDELAGAAQPIRVVRDGSFITASLDSTTKFPAVTKPLLVSTVKNEAGPTIYGGNGAAIPASLFSYVTNLSLGAARTSVVTSSSFYPQPAEDANGGDARPLLEILGTDYIWKCSSWTFARQYAAMGANVWVGEYVVGATAPANAGINFCSGGAICHEDDIQIVFGTTASATAAQKSLTTEMQKAYKAFLSNGNPNTSGVSRWTAATSANANSRLLGGSGQSDVGACAPAFWGQNPQYDYQYYN